MLTKGSWRVEYPISLYPVVVARDNVRARSESPHAERASAYGAAAHLVAVRVLRSTPLGRISLGIAGGAVHFPERVPTARGTRWNASLDLGAGVRWAIAPTKDLFVGYQYNHISNAGPAISNPGLDSHMVRIGVRAR